jgi:hypothetical protein
MPIKPCLAPGFFCISKTRCQNDKTKRWDSSEAFELGYPDVNFN